MREMLTEYWVVCSSEEGTSSKKPRCHITDIHTWVQCFAMYMSVMAGSTHKSVPELLAYLIGIVQASRDHAETLPVLLSGSSLR